MAKYETPEMDVVMFAGEDMITTSGLSLDDVDNGQSGSSNFGDLFPNWGQN